MFISDLCRVLKKFTFNDQEFFVEAVKSAASKYLKAHCPVCGGSIVLDHVIRHLRTQHPSWSPSTDASMSSQGSVRRSPRARRTKKKMTPVRESTPSNVAADVTLVDMQPVPKEARMGEEMTVEISDGGEVRMETVVEESVTPVAIRSRSSSLSSLGEPAQVMEMENVGDKSTDEDAMEIAPIEVGESFQPDAASHSVDPDTVHIEVPKELEGTGLAILHPLSAILCFACGYCVQPEHIHGHLSDVHKIHFFTQDQTTTLLGRYSLPAQTNKPLDGGAPLPYLTLKDGWKCLVCPYKTVDASNSRRHKHDGNKTMEEIKLQTFFAPQHAGYIAVQDKPVPDEGRASDLLDKTLRSLDGSINQRIISHDDARLNSPFLQISEWGSWLGDATTEAIDSLKERMSVSYNLDRTCLQILKNMWPLFNRSNSNVRCVLISPTYVNPPGV